MAILIKSDLDRGTAWQEALQSRDPGLEVRTWPDLGDPAEIEYALVWFPPPGLLASLPNLKAVFSVGAGVDHLLADPDYPRHVPMVRMVEPGLTAGMTEFVVMSVLHHHRFMVDYRIQQQAHEWREVLQVAAKDRRVGIMGLGQLGQDAATKLRGFGFNLLGWSRGEKKLPGVTSFYGADQLDAFLRDCQILVCLLPLTPETRGILNSRSFAKLPRGAAVINVGRGQQLVEADLVAALNSGHVSGATLDVFEEEPLPKDSPLWDHPRVVMTPHIASMTITDSAAQAVINGIRRQRAGEPLEHVFDFERGY